MYPTVDIIMPCYYSNDIITPALEKIVSQTVIDNITLILVNDCSPNTTCDYCDIIEKYKNRIKIKYFKTENNVGPGEARQLGLNNATSDFIWFQDDDDEIYNENTIESLLKLVDKKEKIASVSGQIYFMVENNNDNRLEPARCGTLQGSIFNRDILQKLNIHFEPLLSFKEEDGAFCSLFHHKTVNKYDCKLLQEIVYIRKYFNDHIHVTYRSDIPQSILALIFQKIIILKYAVNNNLNILYTSSFADAITFVPNLLDRLVYFLQSEKKIISLNTYNQLEKSLIYYNNIVSKYNYNDINWQDIIKMGNQFFNGDNFYGKFNEELIYNFSDNYKNILKYIKENFVN